jgi:hypothetical protein
MVIADESDDVIQATIRYDGSFPFTTDHLLSLLTAISGRPIGPEIVFSDESSCSTIEVLTGSQRLRLLLNVDTWQFSRSSTVPSASEWPQISLRLRCRLAAQFEAFALKTVLSFCYLPDHNFICSLANGPLLVNIPPDADRFAAIARLLFPDAHTRQFDAHVESDGLDAVVDATLICSIADRNPGRFMLFQFVAGVPVVQDCDELLSCVSWTNFHFSLLPDVGDADNATTERPPQCVFARTLTRRCHSFAVFINSSGTEAMTLQVKAIENVFGQMVRKAPVSRRSGAIRKRLNGIWRHLRSVSRSLEAILGGEFAADDLWRHSCMKISGGSSKLPPAADLAVYVDNSEDMFALALED